MADVAQSSLIPLVIDLGDRTCLPVVRIDPAGGTPVAQAGQRLLVEDNGDGTCTPILIAAA